jgi:hypothetical protein
MDLVNKLWMACSIANSFTNGQKSDQTANCVLASVFPNFESPKVEIEALVFPSLYRRSALALPAKTPWSSILARQGLQNFMTSVGIKIYTHQQIRRNRVFLNLP